MTTQPPTPIHTRADLIDLADRLGVRQDWHEPDEQNVTASVHGHSFDNAGLWPLADRFNITPDDQVMGIPTPVPTPSHIELHVTLHQNGQAVAVVNLATLFAWATGLEAHVGA